MGSESSILLKGLGVAALVMINGFFVAAELAFVRIRDTQLDPLIAKGNRRARIARSLLRNLDVAISMTQLGITLASLGMGVIAEPVFQELLTPVYSWSGIESDTVRHTLSIIAGFVVNSYLLIVAGELAPKAFAIRKTLPVVLWTARPLAWFGRLTFPFIWLLKQSAEGLLTLLGIQLAEDSQYGHSEEELRLLLLAAQARSAGSAFGRAMVQNALELRHRRARDVMRPRHEIVGFDTTASIAACLDLAERTRYSRFPLCEDGDLDRTLGSVHIKDLYAMRLKVHTAAELRPAARKLIYVPETARLERLLQTLLERRLHAAIVVDEYGGTTGMVTLENILEELVGQIQDEFDQEKPLLVNTAEGAWELSGALPLHALAELVGQPLQEEDVVTVSGLVTQRLGGFPKAGDILTLEGYELRVTAMDGMRVAQLKLTRRERPDPEAEAPGI